MLSPLELKPEKMLCLLRFDWQNSFFSLPDFWQLNFLIKNDFKHT